MAVFFFLLIFLIIMTLFYSLGLDRTMKLSLDYWSNRQFKLWQIICATIGTCFIIAIIFLAIFSAERFSQKMYRIYLILTISGLFSMFLFSIIIALIAWKRKRDTLIANIKSFIEYEIETNAIINKNDMFKEYLADYRNGYIYGNKLYYTKQQIERCFNKIAKTVELLNK